MEKRIKDKMNELIEKVKDKKQFSQLPDSIIQRSLEISKGDIKFSRKILHKYLGVFLTNKILKPKDMSDWEKILKSHKSSQKRDYEKLYKEIFNSLKFNSILDLGCGINGFSILEIKKILPKVDYIGIEASKQIVDLTNNFFNKLHKDINVKVVHLDLFEISKVKKIIRQLKKPQAIFMFQIVDALESFKKNFSKEFITGISEEMNKKDVLILSYPIRSLSGKKKIFTKRKWLIDFLENNFLIKKDFEMFDERFIILAKK